MVRTNRTNTPSHDYTVSSEKTDINGNFTNSSKFPMVVISVNFNTGDSQKTVLRTGTIDSQTYWGGQVAVSPVNPGFTALVKNMLVLPNETFTVNQNGAASSVGIRVATCASLKLALELCK